MILCSIPIMVAPRLVASAAFLLLSVSHSTAADFDPTTVTDFASLETAVGMMASQPYTPGSKPLATFFDDLKYDGHRQIRFKESAAHYGQAGDTYRVEFFHPGWTAKKTVGMFDLANGKTTPIAYDAKLFDWGELKVPEGTRYPDGYAGFRVLAPDSFMKRRFEFLVFMGASYFRAVTTELGFGLSARGLSINTIGGEPEEFPDFTHFWFEEPKAGEKFFRVLALLNGPSVVGAYRFEAMPGSTTEMFVKGTLYLRKPVKSLGISPFSSMFWFGENSHPKPYDFRPEVHDSGGLQLALEDGSWLWRPLDNTPGQLRLSIFQANKLKGFGLGERDREFKNFEDLEAVYHRRPAVWVEPISGFDKGNVTLVEIPTGEETWDNIVAFYQPEELPTATKPFSFSYRLQWLDQKDPEKLSKCTSSRRGFVMDSDDHLYVLDFTAGESGKDKNSEWTPKVKTKITAGEAKILDQRVMRNRETGGWRAFFKLDVPEKTTLLEMSCELMDADKPVSERWVYQWRK
jgi:periplasmic glucans biosynthesis protein